jgi:AbrB family looped-hinge helix DNA binding protein
MRISERGQITIPKHLRERFGMNHNVEVEITPTDQGLLVKKRTSAEHPVDRIVGILDKDALGKGVSVDDYIREVRGRGR